ncbi:MAG: hypothetical protein IPL77_10640 [Flavobacteriales bacterium]|nr:hypothetical protein [Flavobacteriales bacterium]
MTDFTLDAYRAYALAIRDRFGEGVLFRDLLGRPLPERFAAIRHDVDRKPERALAMARIEKELGLRSTYYFRIPYTFDREVIVEIADLGHEVGYHYENLSDTGGDPEKALKDFEEKLAILRTVADVTTISMHGRPLTSYDNRDLWRSPDQHRLLKERFGLLGEVYLDMDYTDVAYIGDTGRNWSSSRGNLRDHVDSQVAVDLANGDELLAYLQGSPHPRLVFQIHPERWTNDILGYGVQWAMDSGINMAKRAIGLLRS